MDDIAVIIPCLNEELTIAEVVGDFRRALPDARVYVFDNNSTDATAALAASAGAIVCRERTQGKGAVVRRAFREVDARCFVLVDGDGTYPAEAAAELVEPILCGEADMVVGDRLSQTYPKENKRPFHLSGNRLVRWAVKVAFGADVSDVMTGYRALSRQFVKSFPVLSTGFEIETEMTIHAADKRMRTQDVPVAYRDRPQGSTSKLRTFSDGAKVLALTMRLFCTYRPFVFFGGIAALLCATSVAFLLPVLASFAQTGLVERFPTLIVCCFALLTALLFFFAGLILQCLRRRELADFEMRLLQICRDDAQGPC